MKKLPKEMIGLQFDKLFYIDMNDFDVEMLLPALFWLVRSGGRDRAGQRIAQIEVTDRTVSLANHPKVKGFNDADGIPLLDKWVRSSLATIGRSGQGGKGKEQIAHLHPLTFLTYKPSLPTESSRMRKAHHFLYHLCLTYVDRKIALGSDKKNFNASIRETFNKGVCLSEGQDQEGRYDGQTALDLETLLQLYYLDGFIASKKSSQERKPTPEPVCFQAASSIASDFSSFIEVYADRVPSEALSRYLVCLLNFELFIYTQRLTKAINQLVLHNTVPPELDKTSAERTPLNIYVDLTQIRGSRSDQIAHMCVNRDVEDLENYFRSSLTLRTLDRYAAGNADIRRTLPATEGAPYIVALNSLRSQPDIRSDARGELRTIISQYSADIDEVLPEEIQSVVDNAELDALAKVVELLASAHRKNGIRNIMKWLGDSGGLQRADGILRGNTKGRRVWRYVMSDMLLETLVQLASIAPEPRLWSKNTIPRNSKVAPDSITLSAFLRFLNERYGLLIDTPPNFDQSVEATAAAKENFAALKQRLRQMGLFLDLSDDFNAQRIFPRFRE